MSKGDGDRDKTPIQFYIPRISARGRAPIPVNQPNWKYSSDADSPPSLGAWIFTAISDIIGVGMIYLAFTEISNPRKWALIGLFGFLMVFITLPFVLQHWRFVSAPNRWGGSSTAAQTQRLSQHFGALTKDTARK